MTINESLGFRGLTISSQPAPTMSTPCKKRPAVADVEQTPAKKRNVLPLETRIRAIELFEKGLSAKKISVDLGCGKTQIQKIIQEKDTIMAKWKEGVSCQRKYVKARRCLYKDLNERVFDWFCTARGRGFPVSGTMIQEKAVLLSAEYDDADAFVASNGWLDRWKKRFNVKCSVLSGESAGVSEEDVADWAKRLPNIIDGYDMSDIFNADETGLYYRALPTRSMVTKEDKCKGTKTSKDRMTVLLCCSAKGEKLKPFVIGHSARPRCFKNYSIGSFGVQYSHNKRAWMTSILFSEWLRKLNNKMSLANRKILLFVDNCSAHPDLTFSHVKIEFLPPNTTSKLQPCDAGIIAAVKANYRKRLLRHVLLRMEYSEGDCVALSKSVSIMDAIEWLKISWQNVGAVTIEKCFAKCGFTEQIGKF